MPVLRLDELDCVVFDLDGVVTDTASLHAAAWKEVLDGVLAGLTPVQPPFDLGADYRRYVDGKPRLEGASSFLASRGISLPLEGSSGPSLQAISREKDLRFVARLGEQGPRVFSSTVRLARRLRAADVPLAVVTASRHGNDVLAAAGLADLVDFVLDGVVAEELRLPGKPDPATFVTAARHLGCRPRRTAIVEDAIAGIAAARRGRFGLVVGVDRGGTGALERAGAHIVVGDLSELSIASRSGWAVGFDESTPARERARDAVLSCGDGRVGVRGDIENGTSSRGWLTLVGGAYGRGADGLVRLLPGPAVAPLGAFEGRFRRTLELRTGALVREPVDLGSGVVTTRFVALARPGVVVVRADGPPDTPWTDELLEPPRLGPSALLASAFAYASGPRSGSWPGTSEAMTATPTRSCASWRSGVPRKPTICSAGWTMLVSLATTCSWPSSGERGRHAGPMPTSRSMVTNSPRRGFAWRCTTCSSPRRPRGKPRSAPGA
jgi:HAD superfamily hydrolase (TIGR01509 family)